MFIKQAIISVILLRIEKRNKTEGKTLKLLKKYKQASHSNPPQHHNCLT